MIELLAFPGMEKLAGAIAAKISCDAHSVNLHHFPDGETLITIPSLPEGAEVAIVATLRTPDQLALPLRFAAETARELGAPKVGLIAPYLAYMRHDKRFSPGQAVSAPLFADFLSDSFDWLITVDPHLHRIGALSEVFKIPSSRISTAPLIANWISSNVPEAIVLGPDSESQQWVAEVARLANKPYEVLEKQRSGDRSVKISVPEKPELLTRQPVILDDIASSGRTMVEAIRRLRDMQAKAPIGVLIHAIFAGDAYADILTAGAKQIVTTDTIPHESNAISVAGQITEAIGSIRRSA